MYPIPHELTVALNKITKGLNLDDNTEQAIQQRVVCLLMRQNRQLRQKVLRLGLAMFRYAERQEDYTRKMGAYVGEQVAFYLNGALKKAVYVNTQARQERIDAVEQFISAFFEDEDEEPERQD